MELPARDNQAVRQGALLLRIDPRPSQVALDRARAAWTGVPIWASTQ
ncbi:biotin/lipoyl-binding protein [Paraburkholderia madseniana]